MNLNLNKPIAFFDIEATGLNISKDRIVEITVLRIMPNKSKELKTWLLNPDYPISPEASEIHGYTNDSLLDKPTFKQKASEINDFFKGCDIGGYNAIKYDVPLLVEEFLRAGIDFEIKKRRLIDVQNIFMKMEQRTLSAAYKFYLNKSLDNAHSSEADTVATYEILEAQIDKYKDTEITDKLGNTIKPVVNDMEKLHEFSMHNRNADLMGQIIYNKEDKEVFNFGKYKGKVVTEIFTKDPGYYSWIMNADFPQYTKKLLTNIKLQMI